MSLKEKSPNFLRSSAKNVFKQKFILVGLLVIAIGFGALVNVWPSLLLKEIVDGPLTTGEESLWKMAFLYLAAVFAVGFLDLIREVSAIIIGQELLLDIRKQMLEHLQKLPMAYYLRTSVGAILSKFTADLDAINSLFSAGLVSALADLFKLIGLFTALFTLSTSIGWLALGALPIIFMLSNFFRKNILESQKKVRKKVSEINGFIQEVYSGLKIIKVFNKETLFFEKFMEKLDSHRVAMNGSSIYDAWFPCIMQIIRAIFIASAILIGAENNGTNFSLGLSIGTLVALVDLLVRIFEPIENIAAEIQTIQQAFAGIDQINQFFREETEEREWEEIGDEGHGGVLTNKDIVIEQVDFEYIKGKKVLEGVQICIREGSKVSIAGRTGSGKTTLMALISGLYPVGKGKITIGGINPYLIPPEKRRKIMGVVQQNIQLFNGTIYENIALKDPQITNEDVWKALEIVSMAETIREMKNGLETKIGEGALGLSFGQMQLLSLARAIVTNPPILLLDELTAGLDAQTEKILLEAIRKMSHHKTIITISHRISGIMDADIVHMMDSGKIVESGSPIELSQKESWYSVYKTLEDKGWQIE